MKASNKVAADDLVLRDLTASSPRLTVSGGSRRLIAYIVLAVIFYVAIETIAAGAQDVALVSLAA